MDLSLPELPVPTSVEVLCNLLLGTLAGAPELPPASGSGVRTALEAVVLPALQRRPCFVSFSGGRDSSAVLAVATDVARRHGLDEPVPAILRYPDAPESEETGWQELVLTHLGLGERVVIDIRDEQDALGSLATRVLLEHGVRWPGNAYMHVPIFEVARGGSLLTGVGGDELLGTRGSRFLLVAHRHEQPKLRDLASLALAVAPSPARAAVVRKRRRLPTQWLTPAGSALAQRAAAREEVAWPHRWDSSVGHWARGRAYAALRHALPTLARSYDLRVTNPLMEPTVLVELAPAGGATGFRSRSDAMTTLFGDLLPAATLTREVKAVFTGALWGPAMRAFALGWQGDGVDERTVDARALREEWLAPNPSFSTILLLHAAWLHAAGSRDQPIASSS